MHIVYGFFGNLYYVLRKYMRGLGEYLKKKICSNGKSERSKQVGEKIGETEKSPNGKAERSKRVGEKIGETEKSPNGKVERSKLIGEKIRKQKDSPNLENGERKDS